MIRYITKDINEFKFKVISSYLRDNNGCYIWQGTVGPRGYGDIKFRNKHYRTHRLVYEFIYGKIPRGYYVCHNCDVPLCGRPSHLFLGTAADNNLDTLLKGRSRNQNTNKTHCKNGHKFSTTNTYRDKKNGRSCRKCMRRNRRERRS